MKTVDEKIREIKDDIFVSNFKEAITKTRALVMDHPERALEQNINHINIQYVELQRANHKFTVSHEDYALGLSKIADKLLLVLEDLQAGAVIEATPTPDEAGKGAKEREKENTYSPIVGDTSQNILRHMGSATSYYSWWVPVSGTKIEFFFQGIRNRMIGSSLFKVQPLGPYKGGCDISHTSAYSAWSEEYLRIYMLRRMIFSN